MMMMRTAGGPAEPVWTRTTRGDGLPLWMWAGIGLSVAAHLGVGAWLMAQRWTPPEAVIDHDQPPPIVVQTYRRPPPPEPKPAQPTSAKPAPPTPLNTTPLPTTPTEVISHRPSEETPSQGPVVTLNPLPDPAPEGTATRPTPQPTAPGVITNPDWVSRPSGAALMRAYPQRALDAGVTGMARLTCQVRVDGTLTGCSVAEETPGGQGFGRAALRLSRDFRMSPRTVDGRPVEGARVNVTLRFTLPEG